MFEQYKVGINFNNEDLDAIMNQETRHYLPGYGRLSFMLLLKSLIDPSFFRVEEQLNRGRVLNYALKIQNKFQEPDENSKNDILKYYNQVEAIFHCQKGAYTLRHDHSLAYRHRNKKRFVFMDYTYQVGTVV